MGVWTKILLIVVLVHFVAGFGYLMIKLSPKKKKEEDN
jgi:preprotein translocase subunit YajC